MKKTLTLLLTVLSLNMCKAEHPINLHLKSNFTSNEDNAALGAALAIGGAVLCTALLLEGDRSYASSWKQYSNGTYYQDIPPFYLQSPKQFFFVIGATVSISGIITMVRNSR